jgi:hypothetical protein
MMVAVSDAYRYYRSVPTQVGAAFANFAGSSFPGRDINSSALGGELVMPLGQKSKFSGEMAYDHALGVEWFRFDQELNLVRGNPVGTFVGWGQLSFAPRKDWTFLGGMAGIIHSIVTCRDRMHFKRQVPMSSISSTIGPMSLL